MRLAALLLFIAVTWAVAQPKPADPKELPKVAFVKPVGAAPGATVRFAVRGLKLDAAKDVAFHEPKTFGRIVGRSKPGWGDAKTLPIVGDTQLDVEVKLPDDTDGVLLPFSVENAAGRSPPFRVVVDRWPTVAEKEPNNGFRQAQTVQMPQAVEGVVSQPLDVDTYRFEGVAGRKIIAEVFASRCGGPLDPVVTLFDAAGRILASADDLPDSVDARIEFVLPADGVCFVSVMDAHDQGGPSHVYRLVLREERMKK